MENKTNKPLFEDNSQALAVRRDDAAVARATQEIQAALVIAQRCPRDQIKVKAKILEACQRKELAELSEYEYSRGGTRITGPTIDLLRAIANRWGNIRWGWTETDRRQGESSVRCFAWDCESNGQSERTFTVKHWRDTQGGGYALSDERDIYELLANMASRRVRACLEEVIDADVVSAALDQCHQTLKSGEKTPLVDRAVKMIVPFMEFGVTQGMIELRLGNKLDAVSENQLASLRRVYKALKDGVGKREDYFKPEPTKPEFSKPESAGRESGLGPLNDPPVSSSAGVSAPPMGQASAAPQSGHPEDGDLGPRKPGTQVEVPPEVIQPDRIGGFNPLKALRGLLSMAKVKEGELLDFWAASGVTDGSAGSLEEIGLSKGQDWLTKQTEDWPATAAKLLAAKKKGGTK